jgi:hypothetical protein
MSPVFVEVSMHRGALIIKRETFLILLSEKIIKVFMTAVDQRVLSESMGMQLLTSLMHFIF